MKSARILALALLAAPALSGCIFLIQADPFRAENTVTTSVAHVSGAAVDLSSLNGDLEVTTDPRLARVDVAADFTCVGETLDEAEDRARHATLDVRRATDAARTLIVRAECGSGRRTNDGVSLRVRLPDATDVVLETTNGSILVRGTDGLLAARTSNGAITVEDHLGPVDVESTNGRLELDGIGGQVYGTTSNGPVYLRLYDDAPGPVDLTSSNGDITARVGWAFAGRVDYATSNGSVLILDPYDRITGADADGLAGYVEIEGSTPRSHLATTNGDFTLDIDG